MYIGLGCLLDPISMLLVTMPVVHPLLISMNIDLLWFGVFYVLLSETGLVTPPVGLNLFAVAGITGTPIKDVIAGVFPYIIILMIMMALLIAFPPLATWLPGLMF